MTIPNCLYWVWNDSVNNLKKMVRLLSKLLAMLTSGLLYKYYLVLCINNWHFRLIWNIILLYSLFPIRNKKFNHLSYAVEELDKKSFDNTHIYIFINRFSTLNKMAAIMTLFLCNRLHFYFMFSYIPPIVSFHIRDVL